MAFAWAGKLKDKLVDMASKRQPAKTPNGPTAAYTIDASLPPATPPAPNWRDTLVDAWPIFMLVCGILISACTQLIGVWAILGYLLVVTAPIVHLLRKIEMHLRR